MVILTDTEHTVDATAKTITLAAPYDALSLGQILKIYNLTTGSVIYDVERTDGTISLASDVITYAYADASMANADEMMIEVDVGTAPTGTSSDPIYTASGIGASTVGDGRQIVPTPGTAVALAASTPIKSVTIIAELDNTNPVVVGGSTVVAASATRRGVPLNAGGSFTIDADNLIEVFVDAVTADEGVTYTYLA